MPVRPLISLMVTATILPGSGDVPCVNIPENIEKAKPLYSRDTLSICVLGDMMMHTAQLEKALQKDGTYDFTSYFEHIQEDISEADIAIANMEYTMGGKPYTGYPSFSAPESFTRHMASCGFDIFLCANNHIMDRSCRGAETTIDKLENLSADYGILFCGIASDQEELKTPLMIRRKGITLAIENLTYGTNHIPDKDWPKAKLISDSTMVKQSLQKAQEANFTLVFPHWGEEYKLKESKRQKAQAEQLARYGADMIIGSHPHVAQGYETLGPYSVPVAYSLGNAVSNMSATNTQLELMATIRIAREDNGDLKMLPLQFTYLWCSRPGGYSDEYTIIPIKKYIDKEEEWKGRWDYDKMISTYERVKKVINIQD